ncbi:hypothetical protein V502_08230 [Pseudogymnoascus sp. VKM F-4520 (FW-2644)]|nr:hypothetical protein V502_08230 [Pseudogymnoascus sp. VKM F-4520 (FW-2644)]
MGPRALYGSVWHRALIFAAAEIAVVGGLAKSLTGTVKWVCSAASKVEGVKFYRNYRVRHQPHAGPNANASWRLAVAPILGEPTGAKGVLREIEGESSREAEVSH